MTRGWAQSSDIPRWSLFYLLTRNVFVRYTSCSAGERRTEN
nr:MAG TPA: hypothetical protein [Caudoviricetes sp.]